MANTPAFVTHALDLLAGLGPVSARHMFGGHGIYYRGVMFALLDDDELYLKADELARPRFEAAGCRQWTYPGPKGPMPIGYWRPPDEAHEEAEAMLPWALIAVEAARRKAASKAARKAAGKTRPGKAPGAAGARAPVRAAGRGAAKAPATRKPGGGARAKARAGRQSRRK
jgi:DNA transformation protein